MRQLANGSKWRPAGTDEAIAPGQGARADLDRRSQRQNALLSFQLDNSPGDSPDTFFAGQSGGVPDSITCMRMKRGTFVADSEKLCPGFGILSTPPWTHCFANNLRVCPNYHAATALISKKTKLQLPVLKSYCNKKTV